MATTVYPAHRFAAIALERELPPGSALGSAISMARYIDGFPHSYTAEQVEAASRLLVSIVERPDMVRLPNGYVSSDTARMLELGDRPAS
jgi:hypothetical protein